MASDNAKAKKITCPRCLAKPRSRCYDLTRHYPGGRLRFKTGTPYSAPRFCRHVHFERLSTYRAAAAARRASASTGDADRSVDSGEVHRSSCEATTDAHPTDVQGCAGGRE